MKALQIRPAARADGLAVLRFLGFTRQGDSFGVALPTPCLPSSKIS